MLSLVWCWSNCGTFDVNGLGDDLEDDDDLDEDWNMKMW